MGTQGAIGVEGAIGVKHGHWQWGDSGCPARLAPAGQGDPEGVLLAPRDREWRGCMGLHHQLRPRLRSAGFWWQPSPGSGAAQHRLPDSRSLTAGHWHMERPRQPPAESPVVAGS